MGAGPPTGKGATVADDSMICMGCRLRIANRRGLCDWCHARTRRAVAAGKNTWAELERQGRVLPAEPGDHDTDEGEPGRPPELVAWLILFGFGLILAAAGLILGAASRYPQKPLAVLLFVVGASAMLLTLALALVRCYSGAPPGGRQ
jgi:hypothetical protein